MCLIFISHKNHPTYKLIVAGNRDEFYNRRTAPAAFWEDHPGVLGGRDLEGGGIWLGMNRIGKIRCSPTTAIPNTSIRWLPRVDIL